MILGANWANLAPNGGQGCQSGAQTQSKIDAEIDAKINTEKVSDLKMELKFTKNDPEINLNVKWCFCKESCFSERKTHILRIGGFNIQ